MHLMFGRQFIETLKVSYKNYRLKRSVFLLFLILLSINSHAQIFKFSQPARLSRTINSRAEESLPILSSDGQRLYFVRSFYEDNVGGATAGQDIWVSEKRVDGVWQEAHNDFPILNNKRNNAIIGINDNAVYLLDSYNPTPFYISGIAKSLIKNDQFMPPESIELQGIDTKNSFIGFYINKEENVLLISMNGSGSYGEEDLYVSLKDDKGKWSTPVNLGPTINTKGFEISPFLSDDKKTLYFSSNGHLGYGDADIFMAQRLYDNSWGQWSEPINLGKEINSEKFDGYFSIYNNKDIFFVSNRRSNYTDIYGAELKEYNEETLDKEIKDEDLELTEEEIKDLFGMPVNRTIYFEFESYDVKQSSQELIDFLTTKLLDSPEYEIELVGHTDVEGSPEFNQDLSEKRAKEVAKYFIKYGINPNRITTRGRGETDLLYTEGSEEEMAKNRRVEIYFTK